MAESDNILTRLHDLLLYVVPQLNRFPRDQKFVLGDRIETKLLEVQEHCLRAYYSRDKRAHLLEANLTLEVTRHLIRLAHGLRLVSNHTYGVLAEKVDEVGRMIGGWLKAPAGARTFLSAPFAAL
ncbi:MAG TPA: diversity-generating retroelement protein Avd [Verrucomicrobiota bacterium]|nr:diversity-generating retroelement protein Avd [Verrucomicrobiota bacterium]HQL78552.1 diversity-generating retroelement protein Avd [Verrucomicrobiota bacterium]